MKKIFVMMLTVLYWGTASMNAQVMIGSASDPAPGAVLDLQSGGNKGLLMPRVILTSASVWAPLSGSAVNGMTVFNTSTATTNGLEGTGMYVWINGSWRLLYHAKSCEGAIIKNGAYSGPASGVYSTAWFGSFQAGWNNAAFSALNKDLCWNKQDASASTMQWSAAVSSCTGDWRLPNLKEQQVLYEALGGNGSAGTGQNFSNLQSPHSNPGGATNMVSINVYWNSTEYSSTIAYDFNFNTGFRDAHTRTNTNGYVRCVRTL